MRKMKSITSRLRGGWGRQWQMKLWYYVCWVSYGRKNPTILMGLIKLWNDFGVLPKSWSVVKWGRIWYRFNSIVKGTWIECYQWNHIWQFNKHALVLSKLFSDIQSSLMKFDKSHCWIQMYDIPVMGRQKEALRQIGSRFG